jgi:hypothetical protein
VKLKKIIFLSFLSNGKLRYIPPHLGILLYNCHYIIVGMPGMGICIVLSSGRSNGSLIRAHHLSQPVLRPNRKLIVCVLRNKVCTHTV